MKIISLIILMAALFFDIWFSDGYPIVLSILVVGGVVYKFTTPFLRI